jgi:hypothetical protein
MNFDCLPFTPLWSPSPAIHIHIIIVTLLYIVHLIMEALLLPPPLLHFSHGHVWYIVQLVIQHQLRRINQMLKSGLPCL